MLFRHKKCFDTIDHDLLLSNLQCYGVEGGELKWFGSYLNGRKQIVKGEYGNSTPKNVEIGIPQGSILGPPFS